MIILRMQIYPHVHIYSRFCLWMVFSSLIFFCWKGRVACQQKSFSNLKKDLRRISEGSGTMQTFRCKNKGHQEEKERRKIEIRKNRLIPKDLFEDAKTGRYRWRWWCLEKALERWWWLRWATEFSMRSTGEIYSFILSPFRERKWSEKKNF